MTLYTFSTAMKVVFPWSTNQGMRGQKDLHTTTSGDKAQLTVLVCVSASGYPLLPLIIFDRKRLKLELTEGQIPGTIYGLFDNGWIDSEIFE